MVWHTLAGTGIQAEYHVLGYCRAVSGYQTGDWVLAVRLAIPEQQQGEPCFDFQQPASLSDALRLISRVLLLLCTVTWAKIENTDLPGFHGEGNHNFLGK